MWLRSPLQARSPPGPHFAFSGLFLEWTRKVAALMQAAGGPF